MSLLAPLNPVQRAAATKATADKFRGRPLNYADGVTCLHLLREQMIAFDYSPPEIPGFKSVSGARRALRATGHDSLEELLDGMLERKPLAHMRVGDIALVRGAPFDAIMISAGGKLLGWYEDGRHGLVNFIPTEPPIGAWGLL